jgi:glutaredoxin
MRGWDMSSSDSSKHAPVITIYTTQDCHWCQVAKRYFADHGVLYHEIDVGTRSSARREMALMTGGTTVPVIEVGQHAMTGWNELEFEKLMTGKFKRR